jgi:hypothetical protein
MPANDNDSFPPLVNHLEKSGANNQRMIAHTMIIMLGIDPRRKLTGSNETPRAIVKKPPKLAKALMNSLTAYRRIKI